MEKEEDRRQSLWNKGKRKKQATEKYEEGEKEEDYISCTHTEREREREREREISDRL